MEESGGLVGSVLSFWTYFGLGLGMTAVFMWLYVRATPYDEVALIKQNNLGAAIAYTGALIGFVMPLQTALQHSVTLAEYLLWGLIAGFTQLGVFFVYRQFYPRFRERLEGGELASPVQLAGVSVAVGLLNAASIVE
ncbi:MAG: DUF350 domain-containing protein [Pseudomonadota bacterium]